MDGDVILLLDASLAGGSRPGEHGFVVPTSLFESCGRGYFFICFSEGSLGTDDGKDHGNGGGLDEFDLINGQVAIGAVQLSNMPAVKESSPTALIESSALVFGLLGSLTLLCRCRA